jgi:hypothetical protein
MSRRPRSAVHLEILNYSRRVFVDSIGSMIGDTSFHLHTSCLASCNFIGIFFDHPSSTLNINTTASSTMKFSNVLAPPSLGDSCFGMDQPQYFRPRLS